jgi:hydroxyacylglutathione hydrolase
VNGFVMVAPGLRRWSPVPLDLVNVYLLDDVLVDAGSKAQAFRLLRALRGQRVAAHALTHGHFDHQGSSHAVCRALGVPLWCGEGEREAMESGDSASLYPRPDELLPRIARRLAGPAHPVDRVLREGDTVGGFTVLETPGHTPGHLAFWRESDRVLVLGDVVFHRDPVTFRRGLRYPYRFLVYDYELNAASARRMAALEPALVCFGHGSPLRDGAAFAAFAGGQAVAPPRRRQDPVPRSE